MLYFFVKKSLNYSANSNHLRTHTYNFYKSVRWKALYYIQSTEGFRLLCFFFMYFLLQTLAGFELERFFHLPVREEGIPFLLIRQFK